MYLGAPQTTLLSIKLAERNYRPFVWPARIPRLSANYEGLIAPQLQADVDKVHKLGSNRSDRFSDEDLFEP